MADETVRLPTGADRFPGDRVRAGIYDAACALLEAATRGDVETLVAHWHEVDGEDTADVMLGGEDPGAYLQCLGGMTTKMLAAFGMVTLGHPDDDEDDDLEALPDLRPIDRSKLS